MSDILIRIKRAILAGNYEFTEKARIELRTGGLCESDALESILNALAIHKTIRSTSVYRTHTREYLHVIISMNLEGHPIYTKGKLVAEMGVETYYLLVSSKYAE